MARRNMLPCYTTALYVCPSVSPHIPAHNEFLNWIANYWQDDETIQYQ